MGKEQCKNLSVVFLICSQWRMNSSLVYLGSEGGSISQMQQLQVAGLFDWNKFGGIPYCAARQFILKGFHQYLPLDIANFMVPTTHSRRKTWEKCRKITKAFLSSIWMFKKKKNLLLSFDIKRNFWSGKSGNHRGSKQPEIKSLQLAKFEEASIWIKIKV